MSNNLFKSTLIRCGLLSAGSGLLLFSIITYADTLMNGLAYLWHFAPDPSLVVEFAKWVGELNFGVPLALACIFGWILCVWWKIDVVESYEILANRLYALLTVVCLIALPVLGAGAYHQNGLVSLAESLLFFLVYAGFGISFLESNNRASKKREASDMGD